MATVRFSQCRTLARTLRIRFSNGHLIRRRLNHHTKAFFRNGPKAKRRFKTILCPGALSLPKAKTGDGERRASIGKITCMRGRTCSQSSQRKAEYFHAERSERNCIPNAPNKSKYDVPSEGGESLDLTKHPDRYHRVPFTAISAWA